MRRQHWFFAGILGALAAATRSAGVLLVLPYLCEWWLSWRKNGSTRFWVSLLKLVPICLIPTGLLAYSYYCWRTTGNPLMFAAVQAHWDRHTEWPWQGIGASLYQLWVQPIGSFYQVHILIDLCATLGFLALTIVGWRRLPLSFTLWNACLLLFMLLNASPVGDPLASNQRLVLELFPGFIMLAMASSGLYLWRVAQHVPADDPLQPLLRVTSRFEIHTSASITKRLPIHAGSSSPNVTSLRRSRTR